MRKRSELIVKENNSSIALFKSNILFDISEKILSNKVTNITKSYLFSNIKYF